APPVLLPVFAAAAAAADHTHRQARVGAQAASWRVRALAAVYCTFYDRMGGRRMGGICDWAGQERAAAHLKMYANRCRCNLLGQPTWIRALYTWLAER